MKKNESSCLQTKLVKKNTNKIGFKVEQNIFLKKFHNK